MNEPKMPKGWDDLTKKQNEKERKRAAEDDQKRKNKILEYLKYFTGQDAPKAVQLTNYEARIERPETLDEKEQIEYNQLREKLQNLEQQKAG